MGSQIPTIQILHMQRDFCRMTKDNELSTRLCATTNYHENQRPGMVIKHSVAILVQAAPIASPGPRVALAWFRL